MPFGKSTEMKLSSTNMQARKILSFLVKSILFILCIWLKEDFPLIALCSGNGDVGAQEATQALNMGAGPSSTQPVNAVVDGTEDPIETARKLDRVFDRKRALESEQLTKAYHEVINHTSVLKVENERLKFRLNELQYRKDQERFRREQ
jgi:hypothetical protein